MTTDRQFRLNLIGGVWQPAHNSATLVDVNPADTTDVIGNFPDSSAADAADAVAAARDAAGAWRGIGPIERSRYLAAAQQLLAERAEEFAQAITREQGKRISEARAEAHRAQTVLDFIRGEARRINGVTTPADDARTTAYTFRVPIGVVALISPWNFPLAIPMWKIAPALIAGCTAVLKPSPFTPLTAAMLVSLFHDAGLPSGVLNLVQGDREPGEALVTDPAVSGVSFTGSPQVGQAIHQAGAPHLLKTQLELGGKNAVVVLDDADLDLAVDAIVLGAFGQAGQRCSATSRVVVDVRVKDELLGRLTRRVSALTVGPGQGAATDVGPVINESRLIACLDAVDRARAAGATLTVGGGRVEDDLPPGYYLRPTILSDVAPGSEIAQEEIFGPVLSVVDADGFDEAIDISNSVKYGMSAAIFTKSLSSAFEAIERFDAGMLHVNRPGVGAYPHLPHVGTKLSQHGPPECSPDVWNFYTEWRSACIRY